MHIFISNNKFNFLREIGKLLMLDKYQEMPDNKIWSIGNQPVHYEVTHLLKQLEKEILLFVSWSEAKSYAVDYTNSSRAAERANSANIRK